MSWVARTLALVAVLASAAPIDAREFRLLLLRIDGHVGARRAEDRAPIAEWTLLRLPSTTITLTVNELRVLAGDGVWFDVVHELEPYSPNMSVDGPQTLLDRLADADADEPLVITGYFRRGQRMLMLSSVVRAKTP